MGMALFVLLCIPVMSLGAQEDGRSSVYIIPIEGEIDQGLTVFLRRSIEKAKDDDASHIIFVIDTFGGRVDSALQITTLIGSLSDITTISYVGLTPEGTAVSWSAGAMIALSTDMIYMAPGTSMGAAAPVMQSAEGAMEPAGEKTVSAVRTQMSSLAEKNGYPKEIALAMVDQDIEILEVYRDGELEIMTRDAYDTLVRNALEGEVITEGPVISASGKLLSLTAGELVTYGVASGIASSSAEILSLEDISEHRLVETSPSAADDAVRIMTGTVMTSLLILIGIIALFMEISSPGFGLPGTIALIAFSALFFGNILLGNVGSLELLLFVIGIALLIVEIFLIPGFGVVGISGIALMTIGLVLSMQDFIIPSFEWQWDLLGKNVLLVLGNIIAGFFLFGLLAFLVPKYTPFKRLTLTLEQQPSMGYTAQEQNREHTLLHQTGVAVTSLHPSGKARFSDTVLQVVTTGDFIEQGERIEVCEVAGNRIVVQREPQS